MRAKAGEMYHCYGGHLVSIGASLGGMELERLCCSSCNSPLVLYRAKADESKQPESVASTPLLDPARIFERLCYMADKKLLRDMQIAVDWN